MEVLKHTGVAHDLCDGSIVARDGWDDALYKKNRATQEGSVCGILTSLSATNVSR